MIKYVLFDLDGTMLPMDQEDFIKAYFGALCKKFCPVLGIDQETMIKGVWKATGAMIKNDGNHSNYEMFWGTFAKLVGKNVLNYIKDFDQFYNEEFIAAKAVCGYTPAATETIKVLKSKGYKVIAATNPIFPGVATNNRLGWAGVNKDDFEIVTTYENSGFCKPNPKYYLEITEKFGIDPKECMMVGNDVDEDMLPTKSLGMDTYLITDCLINKNDTDITDLNKGTFNDFLKYVRMLPDIK